MKKILFIIVIFTSNVYSQNNIDSTFVNNTTLSDEALAKILAKNGCYLATKPNGLSLIRENIIEHDKNGKPLGYSKLAGFFALSLSGDVGLNAQGELIDVEYRSIALDETNPLFARACWPKKKHAGFKELIYPKIPSSIRFNLTSVMTKIFAKELIITKNVGPHTIPGNIYIMVFKRNLFQIGDYLIEKIESQLGDENTLTLDDITNLENRNFLKEHFCGEISLRGGNKEDEADIRRYLKKFYGSDNCTKN